MNMQVNIIQDGQLEHIANSYTISDDEQTIEKKTDRHNDTEFRSSHRLLTEALATQLKSLGLNEIKDFYVDYDYYMCRSVLVSISNHTNLERVISVITTLLSASKSKDSYCIVLTDSDGGKLTNGYERMPFSSVSIYASK
jgi:hypothetical protein